MKPRPQFVEMEEEGVVKSVFVTVGSTQFDGLIRSANTPQFHQVGENTSHLLTPPAISILQETLQSQIFTFNVCSC